MSTLDLFTAPEPPTTPGEWTQLHLSRLGRTYRYRVPKGRIHDPDDYTDHAPSQYRFELEYSDRDGTWREVRNHNTRMEIWALIRERL